MNNQLLRHLGYGEFPDAVTDAELCRVMAAKYKNSIPGALRHFARARAATVRSPSLKSALVKMGGSIYPETGIATLRACRDKMHATAVRELRAQGVTPDEYIRAAEEQHGTV